MRSRGWKHVLDGLNRSRRRALSAAAVVDTGYKLRYRRDVSHARRIATELGLPERGVAAVVTLLADKNTVPFIARYRKEASGGLDEVQIRAIDERRQSHVALESRRAVILETIAEQGALSAELRAQLMAATSKAELEDLYLPFKKKRRTRGDEGARARTRAVGDADPFATRPGTSRARGGSVRRPRNPRCERSTRRSPRHRGRDRRRDGFRSRTDPRAVSPTRSAPVQASARQSEGKEQVRAFL